ncbi:ricin-type beta-trefoil lectin domain protein [Streptomyces sp. ISL-112]|uniref:RICIN domain-containing protein n=1 Tax=unclassified Streptomyces TaxID=2593676 RepID=UPI001BE745A5|nr:MULTISPECIES: RICIN domain-containing protein [unclassified Streptomyces]MBT2425200.1 ricin-type beta-trefoil lectin domain protein [Streptomyces sp. ISL-112]MBT2461992.1 ricin-type beta-trefoil lectin domain protein [Streptomyces sp. ISL-63]
MRKATGSLVLAVFTAGSLTALTAPAQAAPQAKDPYAHIRLERVWAPGNCLSTGGSKKNNARPVLAKCHKTGKTQRWTLKRLYKNKSVFIIKNDKSGKCLVVGAKSRLVQSTCESTKKSHQWTLGSSKIYNKSAGKAIASKSTKAGSYPYLEKLSDSSKARGRQEWGLS